MKKFTIIITTKDRLEELKITLEKIAVLLDRPDTDCIICDDASADGTFDYLHENHPEIMLLRNQHSKGLIFNRNKMMQLANSQFVVSLDDDLHFITADPFEKIDAFFGAHPKAAVAGFRIYWNTSEPDSTFTAEVAHRVSSFAGGAHVWRKSAWDAFPGYPSWFVFYGEEDFASFHLFKKEREIWYFPDILTHHRVNVSERKKEDDYTVRLRRSLRAAWYLFFLFYPLRKIPRIFAYSIWMQLKLKVFKGDFKALSALIMSLSDLFINFPKILRQSNRLSPAEFKSYNRLPKAVIYWKPEPKYKK